jgi:hypothetical protein
VAGILAYHRYRGNMNTIVIMKQIDFEIARLQQARSLLVGAQAKRGPGRPKKTDVHVATRQPVIKKSRAKVAATAPKRVISEEGRARIAAAQKLRWAKSKRAAKKAAKAAAAL